MARPIKCRRVCREPQTLLFAPSGGKNGNPVILAVDEYETIRLIDYEGLSQEKCAAHLDVARTTVQKIYDTARKKLASALVQGLSLKIEGGEYRLCSGNEDSCPRADCYKNQIGIKERLKKGENTMRIAVTYENGEIFQHFGHTEQFKIYDVADGKIASTNVLSTNGSGHGALAGFLQALSVDVLICGGIGGGAQTALANAGIKLYGGAAGNADLAVNELINGTLQWNPDIKCSHHDHGHSEGHNCGSHGCGNGNCGNH